MARIAPVRGSMATAAPAFAYQLLFSRATWMPYSSASSAARCAAVERRPQREPRLRLLAPQRLRARAADRVDAQLGQARRPAEEAVVGELEPAWPTEPPRRRYQPAFSVSSVTSPTWPRICGASRPLPVVAQVDVVQLEAGKSLRCSLR